MSITNTATLTANEVDLMNVGLSGFFVPVGERDDLAAFFGVGVRTVLRWFRVNGRCVPRAAIGRRPCDMFDAGKESGYGDASKDEYPLLNMRLRVFMAASLGVAGGFDREPVYTGNTRVKEEKQGSISSCLDRINAIYTGNSSYFEERAWLSFEIEPYSDPDANWLLIITYNTISEADESDAEEIQGPEYGEETE